MEKSDCKKCWKESLERERRIAYNETKDLPPGYEEKRDLLNIAKEQKKHCESCNQGEDT